VSEKKVTRVETRLEFEDGTFVRFEVDEPWQVSAQLDVGFGSGTFDGPAGWLRAVTGPQGATHFVSIRSRADKEPIGIEWGVVTQ
jgi:hypothetical protein